MRWEGSGFSPTAPPNLGRREGLAGRQDLTSSELGTRNLTHMLHQPVGGPIVGCGCEDTAVSGRGRPKRRRDRSSRRPPTRPHGGSKVARPRQEDSPNDDTSVPESVWARTRSGSRAARGYHYQDDVAAWLCVKVLAGDVDAHVVVPEGFEDVSCEGASAWQVQVKSRQDHRSDFTAAEAAQHVLAVAARDEQRRAAGLSGRPVLVLEKAIEGYSPGVWGQVIADLPSDNLLRPAVERLGVARGIQPDGVRALMERVSVYVLPWQEAREQLATVVAGRYSLPVGLAGPVVLALRDAAARCVDMNAESNWVRRAGLDRTQVEGVLSQAAATVDRSAIEQALADGLCEPVDFDTPLFDARFYEGVAAQPGHVAAGLPVPRPDLVEQIATAVDRRAPVLITGPSGVGKSVLLWISAS